MEYYDRLRYRLLPYIYTLAADTWHRDGTIMRGLVMDFPADRRPGTSTTNICSARPSWSRRYRSSGRATATVYLPAGALWYDFNSGRSARAAAASTRRCALRTHAAVRPRRLDRADRPGDPAHGEKGRTHRSPCSSIPAPTAASRFYEDDGVSRQYLNGAYARIPIGWDEATGTLTLGPREGSYPGMAERRTLHVRWMRPDRARELDLDAAPDATIEYDGRQQSVALER